jgi:hypothetical protein
MKFAKVDCALYGRMISPLHAANYAAARFFGMNDPLARKSPPSNPPLAPLVIVLTGGRTNQNTGLSSTETTLHQTMKFTEVDSAVHPEGAMLNRI